MPHCWSMRSSGRPRAGRQAPDFAGQLRDQARPFVLGHGKPVHADDPVDDDLELVLEVGRVADVQERVQDDHHLSLEPDPDVPQQLLSSGDPIRGWWSRRRRQDWLEGHGPRVFRLLLRPLDPLE